MVGKFYNFYFAYPATKIVLIIGKAGIIGFVRTYIQQLQTGKLVLRTHNKR